MNKLVLNKGLNDYDKGLWWLRKSWFTIKMGWTSIKVLNQQVLANLNNIWLKL